MSLLTRYASLTTIRPEPVPTHGRRTTNRRPRQTSATVPNLCGLSRAVLMAMLSQDELDLIQRMEWSDQLARMNAPRRIAGAA